MTRKDFARIFRVGETLEITSHWRRPNIVGSRRTVKSIGRHGIEMVMTGSYPSDLAYEGVTRIEREDDGRIRVEWGDAMYITYRVVEGD